jgi:hypothetical protein
MRARSFPTTSEQRLWARIIFTAVLASSTPSWADPAPGSADASSAATDVGAAKLEFTSAQRLFKAGKYAEALPLFRSVAEATRSPNAWLYVGHCMSQLGNVAEAHKVFALVVKEITEHPEPKYEPTREAAVTELAILNVRVGKVVISFSETPRDLQVTLDGIRLAEREIDSSVVVQPGIHHIEAQASGVLPVRRDVNIEGGEMKAITLSFRKADEENATGPVGSQPQDRPKPMLDTGRSMRTVGYVTAGFGIAGVALFATTALMARGIFQKLEDECPSGCVDAAHLGDIDRGKALQTTANIGLVVGLLGIGGGTTLVILGRDKSTDGPRVSFSDRGGTVSYTGHF